MIDKLKQPLENRTLNWRHIVGLSGAELKSLVNEADLLAELPPDRDLTAEKRKIFDLFKDWLFISNIFVEKTIRNHNSFIT